MLNHASEEKNIHRHIHSHSHTGQTSRLFGRGISATLLAAGLVAGLAPGMMTSQADAAGCCITDLCLDLSASDCEFVGGLSLGQSSDCSRTECYSAPFMISPAPGSAVIDLPQFDDQGGSRTLDAVTMRGEASIVAQGQLTNLSPSMSIDSGGAAYSGSFSFDLPFLGTHPFEFDGYLFCADLLEPGQTCDMGPHLIPGAPLLATAQATAAQDDLSGFLGAGSVSVTADADGSFALSVASPASFSVSQVGIGSIQMAYQYQASCDADLNHDNVVGVEDLIMAILDWGCQNSLTDECPGDVNKDLVTNVQDVGDIILAWGPCAD